MDTSSDSLRFLMHRTAAPMVCSFEQKRNNTNNQKNPSTENTLFQIVFTTTQRTLQLLNDFSLISCKCRHNKNNGLAFLWKMNEIVCP